MVWTKGRGLVVGATAAVVFAGALVPTIAMARSNADSGPVAGVAITGGDVAFVEVEGVAADGLCAGFGLRGGLLGGGLDEVATALGVDVDTLQDAIWKVRGDLRPEERPTDRPTDEERAARIAEFHAALAAELGVTAADVEAAFEAAQPTEEDIEALRTERIEAMKARLDEAVAAGNLTQEQADRILDHLEDGEGFFGFRHGRPFQGWSFDDAGAEAEAGM